ncbi:MAG TPA: YARHG domain-containing protein, partial [Kofleriaceae bacterium]|nr:YARHG domain-containing protein [Kofleriaceae bacterium]
MRWIWVIAMVSACGKSDAPAPVAGSGAASGSGTAGSGSAVAAGSGSATGSGSGSAVAAVALSPKIKAARCGEPCLFLVDTPLAKMTETFTAECAGMKTPDLGYTDCKQLDYVRNCIYAAHGVVFKKKRWKV